MNLKARMFPSFKKRKEKQILLQMGLGRGETTALECAFLKLERRLFGFRHNLPLWLLLTEHLLGKPL